MSLIQYITEIELSELLVMLGQGLEFVLVNHIYSLWWNSLKTFLS